MTTPTRVRLGWLPGYPDFRDFTLEHSGAPPEGERPVGTLLHEVGVDKPMAEDQLPPAIDLSAGFPPIEDQGDLGSCTANAGVALLEYLEREAMGEHIDASRLFLYKATRNLLNWQGDTGAFIRTTMKAMVLFGVPPEEYWPYEVANFDEEPSAFCYAFGQNYRSIQYYRIDPPGTQGPEILQRVKTNLAAKLPLMFGFTVYSSMSQTWTNGGAFPFPTTGEQIEGGHAVVAVGYDDARTITNEFDGSSTTGAIRIRNSWGTGWGDTGYGWLAYRYVQEGMAEDWWSMIKSSWVDTNTFGLDGTNG